MDPAPWAGTTKNDQRASAFGSRIFQIE